MGEILLGVNGQSDCGTGQATEILIDADESDADESDADESDADESLLKSLLHQTPVKLAF